jgi:hypothetical protein
MRDFSHMDGRMTQALYLSYDGMTDPLGQAQVIPYLEGLSRQGIAFTLVSCEKPARFAVAGREMKQRLERSGIRWHPLPYTRRPPVLSTLFDIRQMRRLVGKLHEEQGFEVVHCRSYIPAMIGAVIRRECIERVGLFHSELSISAGWDMWRRIASAYRIDFVNAPLVLYRQHGTNISLRLDIYQRDMELALRRMFDDPDSGAVHRYKNEAFGRSYLMLAGAHHQRGDHRAAARLALRGLLNWPAGFLRVAALPLRALRRRLRR